MRRIEESHRAGVELLEAARRQQVRALELVWASSGEGAFAALDLPAAPSLPSAPNPLPAPPAPRRTRRPIGELRDRILAALPDLPEVFDRNDVVRTLGETPHRGSLHRTLDELRMEGVLERAVRGEAREPSRYRKAAAEAWMEHFSFWTITLLLFPH